jgi:hypothetical protein
VSVSVTPASPARIRSCIVAAGKLAGLVGLAGAAVGPGHDHTDGALVASWLRVRADQGHRCIPEIAQVRRLGHRLPGVRGVYSHVTPVMIARITNSLQARWQASHAPTPLPQRQLHAA